MSVFTLALLLAACGSDPVPEPVTAPPPPPQLTLGELQSTSPTIYTDAHLVVVATSSAFQAVPRSQILLHKQQRIPKSLRVLRTSEFTGLAPCKEIAIANAFRHEEDALNYVKLLRTVGIDAHVKAAGRWVGGDLRVDATCSPPAAASTCGDGGRLVLSIDASHFLATHVDGEPASRALRTLRGQLRPIDTGRTAWAASLLINEVGKTTTETRWKVYDLGTGAEVATCPLSGFAGVVYGTPHRTWIEKGRAGAPGCGSPEPYGVLACDLPVESTGVMFASTAEHPLVRYAPSETAFDLGAPARAAASLDPAFVAAQVNLEAMAEGRGEALVTDVEATSWLPVEPGPRPMVVARFVLRTGDANAQCGGGDLREEHLAASYVGDEPGSLAELAIPFTPATYAELGGVLVPPGTFTPAFALAEALGSVRIDSGPDPVCSMTHAYCDSPC